MKNIITVSVIVLTLSTAAISAFAEESVTMPLLRHGLYIGVGGSWNTIDEAYDSFFINSIRSSARDHYNASRNRLAPLAQIGYWAPICECWLWGATAQWKYLGYKTENVNASRGQYIPNATFSSINFFGPNVMRDFTSQTEVNNEFLLLAYIGKEFHKGYFYVGAGPALFTASNSIYVSSIHRPNGVGNNLVSTSVNKDKIVWGGAVQIGYNYYIDPTFFLGLNYTYSQTGTNKFKNSVNAARLNGSDARGATTLNLNRSIEFRVQEVMFSLNKIFDI